MTKILKEEKFEEEDWSDVAVLISEGLLWLYTNSSVKVTPDDNQLLLIRKNPTSSHLKKKKQKD
jgi:hypothetical protein